PVSGVSDKSLSPFGALARAAVGSQAAGSRGEMGGRGPSEGSRPDGAPAGPALLRPIWHGEGEELRPAFRHRLSPRSRYLFAPHDTSKPEQCLAEFAERIRLHQERKRLAYVVEQDGAIVGYFYLTRLNQTEGRPPLLGIGLADALHGKGIGGAML